ncbi:protein O-mannosyl-transferase Tmtc2 [Plodia interpunctella]|uniref:protein O-mannosyl-transferase Tmtc2 n=1 Tax=Plodia interpunctella TaxID=58824 RepID=UPI00236819C4|nr:protein O-mannosyl-transferase TMTC2 [Plodia interpunctella]
MGVLTFICAAVAFLLYYNTLDAGFVYDDRRAILSNPDVMGHTTTGGMFNHDFWGTPLNDPGSHGSYRPLCVLSYRINYIFSGFKPYTYHLINVLLHCTATILVVMLARILMPTYAVKIGTAVAGLTFAAHPIHTEAVAGIVGRADVAACNFLLLSFLLYRKHVWLRDKREQVCITRIKNLKKFVPQQNQPEQSFQLSCHGLLQHILINCYRFTKYRKSGPLNVLNTSQEIDKTGKMHANGKTQTKAVKSSLKSNMKANTKTNVKFNLKPNVNADYYENVSESVCVSEAVSDIVQWCALGGAVAFAVAGTLCKESALVVLPLCIFYDVLKGIRQEAFYSKNRWRSIMALGAAQVILMLWRLKFVGGFAPVFAAADNPTAREKSFLTRFLTFSYLPVFNFFLLLLPLQLSFDWSMDSIPRITSIFDARNICTLIFYSSLIIIIAITIQNLLKKPDETVSKRDGRYASKKQNTKAKHKRHQSSKQNKKASDSEERKGSRVYREYDTPISLVCSCKGCGYPLADTETCVSGGTNNNNILMYNYDCVCAFPNTKCLAFINSRRYHCHGPHVSMLMMLAFMIFPFLPATNLFYYVGFVVAERILYMPSVGFCLLLGFGAGVMTKKGHMLDCQTSVVMILLLIVFGAMCGNTVRRSWDWKDEETLYRSAVHVNPPKAYGNLGSIMISQGKLAEAQEAFEMALHHRPNMADVHYNLGIVLQTQKRYNEAIKSFNNAISYRPSMALAYVNMGVCLVAEGRLEDAAKILRAGANSDGTSVRDRRENFSAKISALVQLAALHKAVGRMEEAHSVYEEALEMLPDHYEPTQGWTRSNIEAMAEEVFDVIRKTKGPQTVVKCGEVEKPIPKDAAKFISLAEGISRNVNKLGEAEKMFKKAVKVAPKHPSVREQYSIFLKYCGKYNESARQMVRAAKLAPEDGRRAWLAGQALRDADRSKDAEKWYRRAVELKPDNADYQSNLGAIHHINGKYAEAVLAYNRALTLVPDDEIILTNMRRVASVIARKYFNVN